MKIVDRTDKSDEPSCNYCGSKTPDNGFKTKDVIHRSRDEYTQKAIVITSRFTVCDGAACGGNLQMAYEG